MPRPALSQYRCERCRRKLREGRWIFSTWRRVRYCWPGEGCNR